MRYESVSEAEGAYAQRSRRYRGIISHQQGDVEKKNGTNRNGTLAVPSLNLPSHK